MTTIIKQVNDTTVSLLTAVGTVANSVAKTVTTTADTLDMLDAFISQAKLKQQVRIHTENVTYEDEIIEDASLEAAKRQLKISKELTDDNLKKLYQITESKIRASLALARVKPE